MTKFYDDNSVKKDFGRALKDIRTEKGMTLEELAKTSGVSQRHLILIEQGKTNVTLTKIERISRSLNINTKKLFENY